MRAAKIGLSLMLFVPSAALGAEACDAACGPARTQPGRSTDSDHGLVAQLIAPDQISSSA
jgi:hypothetical protein